MQISAVIENRIQMKRPTVGSWQSPRMATIAGVVADHCFMPVDVLRRKPNQRIISEPRQIACWLMRRMLPWASLAVIGRYFGGQHHTTVLHGIAKIEQKRKKYTKYAEMLDDLEARAKRELSGPAEKVA